MPRSPRPASCICVTLPSHSGRVRLTSLLALSSLLLTLCTLPFISHAASFGINSLSPWERAGVRVRSLRAGVRVRSIAEETKEKHSLSPRAVSPHPNPLPEGEGIVTANRSPLTAHSLSWLSEHAWMNPPAQATSTDRSARMLSPPAPVPAGTTYAWNQTGTAAYTTATNWTPTRTTPAVTDVLVFDNNATTIVTSVPTETIAQLSVSGSTNVTLQAGAANTLTIGGDTGTDLSVASGSQLNVNTNNALTISVTTGATGSISGSMTFSATASTAHKLTAADATGITFNSGSVFTQSTNSTGNVLGTGTSQPIVFASGSIFDQKDGSNPFQKTAPASVVVFQTGSLFRISASGVGTSFSGRTYANFEMNAASSTQSASGSSALVMDDITVTAGTFNFGMTGTPGHSIKGNINVAGSAVLNFNPASAGTVSFDGSAAQTITTNNTSGNLTFNANQSITIANSNGVTLSNGGATLQATTINAGSTLTVASSFLLSLGGAVTDNGTFTVNGHLFCGTNIVSGSGAFTKAAGGTLGI